MYKENMNKYYAKARNCISFANKRDQRKFVCSDFSLNEMLLLFFQSQVPDANTRMCIVYNVLSFVQQLQRQRIAH